MNRLLKRIQKEIDPISSHLFNPQVSETRIFDLRPGRPVSPTFSFRTLPGRVLNIRRLRPFHSRLQRVKLVLEK